MTLRRIARDKRSVLVPLLLLGMANLGVYLLGVAPLRSRVSAADERALQVANEVRAAQAQVDQTKATVDGRGRATEQLRRFYDEVLPVDQATARRLTYLDLARLAQAAGLRVTRRAQAIERDRGSQLERLDMSMVLEGRYEDMREFLHDVETASDFVVITTVALARAAEESGSLVLTMELSTYFHPNRER